MFIAESNETTELYSDVAWKDGKMKQLEKQLDTLKTQMENQQISYRHELEQKQNIIEEKVTSYYGLCWRNVVAISLCVRKSN